MKNIRFLLVQKSKTLYEKYKWLGIQCLIDVTLIKIKNEIDEQGVDDLNQNIKSGFLNM